MGGITYRGGCVVSKLNGGFNNGGFTLRLKAGKQEIDGKQALALARTRHNDCNPKESDLTRARRQQKILGSIKDKVTSLETFVRLPWVSWAAPKAIRSDMSGPSLLGLVGAELTGGTAKPTVLKPTGAVTLPDGGAGLTRRRREQAARRRPVPRRLIFSVLLAVPLRPSAAVTLTSTLAFRERTLRSALRALAVSLTFTVAPPVPLPSVVERSFTSSPSPWHGQLDGREHVAAHPVVTVNPREFSAASLIFPILGLTRSLAGLGRVP